MEHDFTYNLITYPENEHHFYRDYAWTPKLNDGYGQFGRYSFGMFGVNKSIKNQSPNRVVKRRAKKKLGNQSRKKNYGH
jgi:hypothetical protein